MRVKKKLKTHHIPYGTDKWYDFRFKGLGGSEIGIICSPPSEVYKCQAQLFYEKLGLHTDPFQDNKYTIWGKIMEEQIANIWQYWDWKKNDYVENYINKDRKRRCYRVNGFVSNPDYPNLFASVDRIIGNNEHTYDGIELPNGGVLEIKTMSGFVAKKWHSVPNPYLYQVHQYMMIFELDYAEIAVLIDGREFMVYPVERDEMIINNILTQTYNFWEKRIVPAKILVEEYNMYRERGDKSKYERIFAEIQRYEPDPDESQAYKEFINSLHEPAEIEKTIGDQKHLDAATWHKALKTVSKSLDKRIMLIENIMRKKHIDSNAEYLTLNQSDTDYGYTRLYVKSNQKNPTFDNRVNIPLDEYKYDQFIQEVISDMDIDEFMV